MRERVFPILTLIVAIAWIVGGIRIAAYLHRLNEERFIAGTMAAGAAEDQSAGGGGLSSIFRLDPKQPSRQQTDRMRRLKEQVGWVHEITRIWRRVMLGTGGFLIGVGVLSVFRRWVRILHLLAGVVILAGTVASLIALNLLVDPAAGGLPPLSFWTPVLVAVIQGFYGVVLLIAFAKRAKATRFDAVGSFIS